MYYLCELHHQDKEKLHYVYDTKDKTCCFCTLKDYNAVKHLMTARGERYKKILNYCKAQYMKYKVANQSEPVPFCGWITHDDISVNVNIDYSEIYPQFCMCMYPTYMINKFFKRTDLRFHRTDGSNMFWAQIAYEFFVSVVVDRNLDCFVSLFNDLKFITSGVEWNLVVDKSEITYMDNLEIPYTWK